MPDPNPAALEFLLRRRSRPARTLAPPAPSRSQLEPLLTAAARSPDHGKLEPWRFIVLERPALQRLAGLAQERAARLGLPPERAAREVAQYAEGILAVAVIAAPRESEKVPEIEQLLSAGGVCLALLNAALAAGWGANWLTGRLSHDRSFVEAGLGLQPHELVAGLIFIGSETVPPPERPRPDLGRIVTWMAR